MGKSTKRLGVFSGIDMLYQQVAVVTQNLRTDISDGCLACVFFRGIVLIHGLVVQKSKKKKENALEIDKNKHLYR
jgi:hypothetical protein